VKLRLVILVLLVVGAASIALVPVDRGVRPILSFLEYRKDAAGKNKAVFRVSNKSDRTLSCASYSENLPLYAVRTQTASGWKQLGPRLRFDGAGYRRITSQGSFDFEVYAQPKSGSVYQIGIYFVVETPEKLSRRQLSWSAALLRWVRNVMRLEGSPSAAVWSPPVEL